MKRISILGSTGSIGTQALDVIKESREEIKVVALAAGKNKELVLEQVRNFKPELVSVAGEEEAHWLEKKLDPELDIKVNCGQEGLVEAAVCPGADMVLTAVSGAMGLRPSVEAIKAGKNLALANKETLVAAGALVMQLAEEYGVNIKPVDSEHSAVWQCLQGENVEDIDKIILTASGGPFRNLEREQLEDVTPGRALKHPNWDMGAKITIDSATLMNKGLEVIEARWLFGVDYDNIEVLVHPQSIIHSMVEFVDGSVKAQMGPPDMYLPIQYALTHPRRSRGPAPRLPRPVKDLTFESPDLERFPCLKLAYEAGRQGGTMPAVLNAANEVAVELFLQEKTGFMGIPRIVEKVLEGTPFIEEPSLEEIFEADGRAREEALRYV